MGDQEKELETVALAWPACAQGVEIVGQASYDHAAGLLVNIATLERRIREHHAPIKKATFEAHRAAVAAENRLLEPLHEARADLNGKIKQWVYQQEQARRELQRQAEAEQRRRDEDARLALASEAEEQGAEEETVDEILDEPAFVSAPVVAPTFRKAAGVGTPQRWEAQVYDIKALCRAVAEGQVSAEYVVPNMKALNAMAPHLKQSLSSIPGVRAVLKMVVTVRKRV